MCKRVLLPLFWSAFLFLASGCAHQHLRWNTVQQSTTLTDIYEQQVLDNLARFVVDPHSLPSFAYPNLGGSDVSDSGNIGNDLSLNRAGFASNVFKVGGGRGMKEAWTLTPVYDVRRLELMRCAYQRALVCAGVYDDLDGCPNCDKIQRAFYMGDAGSKTDVFEFTRQTGRTTPACFAFVRWFGVGGSECVPRHCSGIKVGRCGDTYVWVLPGGQDELTKLTLTILDYAFSPPGTKVPGDRKVVTWYIGSHGKPTTPNDAAQVIQMTMSADRWAPVDLWEKVERVQMEGIPSGTTPPIPAAAREQFKIERMLEDAGQPTFRPSPIVMPPAPFGPLPAQLQLDFLTPQGPISPF